MTFLSEETVEFFVDDFGRKQGTDDELFKVDFGEIAVGCDPKIAGGQLFFVDYLTGKKRCCPCDRIVSIGYYDPDCPRASETPF